MNREMRTFRTAVEQTPGLGANAFRHGLQALSAADRAHIECEDTRKLSGSVDLDTSLLESLPTAHRWDYAIGYRRDTEIVYWVEVHPGSPGDVAVVQDKLAWLKTWLRVEGVRLRAFVPRYVWISSGRTTFTRTSPALRRLAQQGLQTPGRTLRIA